MASPEQPGTSGADGGSTETARLWLLGIIATLLVLGALSLSRAVTLPLVFALFLLAVFWPLRRLIARRVSGAWASAATFVAALGVVCGILAVFYLVVQRLIAAQDRYVPKIAEYTDRLSRWLEENGLPPLGEWLGEGSAQNLITGVLTGLYQFFGALIFILVLFLLGMPAMEDMQRKLGAADGAESERIGESFRRSAVSVQAYVAITSLTSAITGVLTYLFCLLVGIDLALVWGVLAFLLNYIPTIGSILAIIPPLLMTLLQYGTLGMTLIALVGLGIIQMVMGNYVHPKLAGPRVALRPVFILFSLTLWGYIWGAAGAFLATPIMTTLAIFAANHERTKWIARILSRRLGETSKSE